MTQDSTVEGLSTEEEVMKVAEAIDIYIIKLIVIFPITLDLDFRM